MAVQSALASRSPRTRGDGPKAWHRFDGAESVLPAHAGMAHRSTISERIRSSSPRTRGDGPSAYDLASTASTVLPAHAGMARPSPARWPASRSSPRTRGDGPNRGAYGGVTVRVLPAHAGMARTWPSTASSRWRVLPAHAGMARPSAPPAAAIAAFSPHTRGWPAAAHHASPCGLGSPRTRGDGPYGAASAKPAAAFSPHTRGWPVGQRGDQPGAAGSPRTRGDGPMQAQVRMVRGGVPPAHAGMARTLLASRPTTYPFSPHTRGWPASRRPSWTHNALPQTSKPIYIYSS